jgi:hypothetical protein
MVTQRIQMKGVLPCLVRWACRTGTRDLCSALAALVGRVENIFFLTVHYFNCFVPIAQQARRTAVLGRLYLSMCLCLYMGGFARENWPLSHAKFAGGWLPSVHLFSTVWQPVSGKLFQSRTVPERNCSRAELFQSGTVPEQNCSRATTIQSFAK